MKPVIFLAFANERRGPSSRYLRNLKVEREGIRKALEHADRKGLCELIVEPDITRDRVFSIFQEDRYRDRIAIFHYGGHADDDELHLEANTGGNEAFFSAGLVKILKLQSQLRLVFLNGCATQDQATLLKSAGIPAIVGTSRKINDDDATLFAKTFYRGLGGGANIGRAFKEGESILLSKHGITGVTRGMYWEPDPEEDKLQFPWRMISQEVEEFKKSPLDWKLDDDAKVAILEKREITPETLKGFIINGYQIKEYLGQGQFGFVVKAAHVSWGSEAAIKISHKVTKGYDKLLELISLGNKGLRSLDHPNIAEVLDSGEAEIFGQKRIFITMELVHGNRLDRTDLGVVAGSRKEVKSAIDTFLVVCRAIKSAHETEYEYKPGINVKGVKHGNLKTRKVIFAKENVPKIIDFQLADLKKLDEIEIDTPDQVLEEVKNERWEHYFPPEWIKGSLTNVQTDVFSLGAILFELMSGKRIGEYPDIQNYEEIHKLLKSQNRHIPKYVSRVIYKATHPIPASRYKSVQQIIDGLQNEGSFLKKVFGWFKRK